MKKWIAGITGVLGIAMLLILFLIPKPSVNAESAAEFEIQNQILIKYNGKDSTCVIPPQITTIGPEAFKNAKLTAVTIPSNVTEIGESAFYGCSELGRVTIEEGVKTIGVSAFSKCDKLYLVSIPASVTKIGAGAFSCDPSLTGLQFSPDNQSFFMNDSVLFNRDSTELIQYLAGRKSTSYEIPFTVKKIDKFAFWGAGLLTNIRISNNIKEITSYAFANCTGLTKVFLPESVTKIDAYAFAECSELTYVGMENPVVQIHPTAFSNCSKKLVSENGVKEAVVMEQLESGTTDGITQGDDSYSGGSIATDDITKGNGKDHNIRKSFASSSVPRKEIDVSDPNTLGATKIVNGKALVIISENKTK